MHSSYYVYYEWPYLGGFDWLLILTLSTLNLLHVNIVNLNLSRALLLSVMLSETMVVQYLNYHKCPIINERKQPANKRGMIQRVRSGSGYRSIMRYIMSFLITWLWLKSSVQYEMKNLPWFNCVCMCCVGCVCVCITFSVFCFCPFFFIYIYIMALTVIPSGIWSDHSPLNGPLIT